ncbi:hypothetical protein ACFLZN_01090, partial [Nanoarchaeota archaeon]
MEKEKILQKLKDSHGLKNKHVLILKALSKGKQLTAENLSDVCQIPLGRIYSYLNELVKFH